MTRFQPDPNAPIYVELTTKPGVQQTSLRGPDLIAKSQAAIDQAMNTVYQMAEQVVNTVEALPEGSKPKQVEIEFGLNLDVETNAYIAKASGSASINVKLTWRED